MISGSTESTGRRIVVREVATRVPLPPHVTVEAAVAAVMCALTERLTPGGAHRVLENLPEGVRGLFERCVEHRSGPVSTLDRSALLTRIAEHFGVTPIHADGICRAVLSTIREQLPPDITHRVSAQLPADLRELWHSTPAATSEAVSGMASRDPALLQKQVLGDIAAGELPAGMDSTSAFMAVMCTFFRRLSAGEVRHVLSALPATLRPFVTACALHRDEPAESFDRDEFLRRVAEHLGTTPQTAAGVVRAVFAATKRCLPTREIENAASQLPPDLRALWEAR